MISLLFRCGVTKVNTVEVPQYFKFTCTESHTKGSLEKNGRKYGLQIEFLKRYIEHSVIKESNFADLKNI